MTNWEQRRDEEAKLFVGNSGEYSFCCGVDWAHDVLFKGAFDLNKEMLSALDWTWECLHGLRTREGLIEKLKEVREKARQSI